MNIYNTTLDLVSNPKHTRWISNILVAGEALLCAAIIFKVPYTEIDWTTYMQQVSLFLSGERDYTLIKGDTGPLVYPAMHVYLYSLLYYLTDRGTNIVRAQCIFALLYLTTLALVLACYRRVNAPPWLLLPLVLSKRLHSIFLLRLFNDTWATLALWVSIWALQRRNWAVGAIAWGWGLGVKMTLLLAAPALAIIIIQGVGTSEAFFLGAYVFVAHLSMAVPFLNEKAGLTYFWRAFDLSRQFLFKWTVNWRFVGEEVFLSRNFAVALLVVHTSLLLCFMQAIWIKPSSSSIPDFIKKYTRTMDFDFEQRVSKKMNPLFVMDTMLSSMAIGLLCARSLHYQFYAYLGWASPYLLWRSGMSPIAVMMSLAAQEYFWLVYPSTDTSSTFVVALLALQIVTVSIGARNIQQLPHANEGTKRQAE